MTDPTPNVHRFTSRVYPGDTPGRWVFITWLMRPLAVCMLPVMIGALVAVLQGFPPLSFLTVGFPLAIALAFAWTIYRLQATQAACYVRPGGAAMRSVWECAYGPRTFSWHPILELRTSRTTLTVALGDTAYELDRSDWPEVDALLQALIDARGYEPVFLT